MKSEDMVVRTFVDNLDDEITRRYAEIGYDTESLTHDASRAIVDLVLERTAEFFEAYANQWQPGSAFRSYHVSAFIRGLKDDPNRFGPNPPGCSDNPGDL